MSTDLFGNEIDTAPAASPASAAPVVNDMRVIMDVLNRAVDEPGYAIAGPTRRVYRRTNNKTMKHVPRWELEAVLQLIDSGQLIIGGTHVLRCGAIRQAVNSVLVPTITRQKLKRWNALKPMGNQAASTSKKGA
ncbi:hypothetical protein ACSHWB_23505 [Lentzea sp. HUAS TT2]|uniref:hypothetical protein n=1 Tax=Lentzea sp. HUAS TT2 TaxID=3447454 RepID=UPI003F728C45